VEGTRSQELGGYVEWRLQLIKLTMLNRQVMVL
jgi:hypothetical protein